MAMIEGIRVRNFKALRDVKIGCLWNDKDTAKLTPLTAVIGRNGVGKSTLFDTFGFIADCLRHGVEEALDKGGRNGFNRVVSQGSTGPIEFEIYYRQDGNSRPITYELAIALDRGGRPYVQRERLRQRRSGQKQGWPFSFLILEDGKGLVWVGDAEGVKEEESDLEIDSIKETAETERFELEDTRKLGIATLGALKQHPRISAFREFIENWYLSYFTPDSARGLPLAGPQKHLNLHGDNLGNVVQFMEREHPKKFESILSRIAKRIPGIESIKTLKSEDGRVLICFNDAGFKDPFYAQQMSDGTLKVFAYLLLLEDPTPPPFLCIEEPENGVYHKLLDVIANEFREHATGKKGGSQVFITTHQPYLVDSLDPEEVWILKKGADGYSTVERASDSPIVTAMVEEGQPLGALWFSDYFDNA